MKYILLALFLVACGGDRAPRAKRLAPNIVSETDKREYKFITTKGTGTIAKNTLAGVTDSSVTFYFGKNKQCFSRISDSTSFYIEYMFNSDRVRVHSIMIDQEYIKVDSSLFHNNIR